MIISSAYSRISPWNLIGFIECGLWMNLLKFIVPVLRKRLYTIATLLGFVPQRIDENNIDMKV